VLEIGAGFNTPTVTRFPMESIVRDVPGAKLIRVNPTHPHVPLDIDAIGLKSGWQILQHVKVDKVSINEEAARKRVDTERAQQKKCMEKQGGIEMWRLYKQKLGHFDWNIFLRQLAS
jgi:hypothetical protein